MMARSPHPRPLPRSQPLVWGFKLEEGLLLRSDAVFQLKKHCAIWLYVSLFLGWHGGGVAPLACCQALPPYAPSKPGALSLLLSLKVLGTSRCGAVQEALVTR